MHNPPKGLLRSFYFASVPKVSVNVSRDSLYLLGRFPNKDGSPGFKQARIATGLPNTPANFKVAEKRAKLAQRQLEIGSFDWADWTTTRGITWRTAIDKLYQKKVVLGRTGQSTWEISYMGRLKQMPPLATFNTDAIEQALSKYSRDQCSYRELYYLLTHMARLCNVPFPEVPTPTYGKAALVEVPTDDQIIAWVEAATGPARWYFGLMATYGLRPHEIEVSNLIAKNRLQVPDGTKTGFRTVVPLMPEWVDRFDLSNPVYREERISRRNPDTGRHDQVAQYLYKEKRRLGIPWRPYSLRHAYAARLWREGGSRLDIGTAAALMGHTVKIHMQTYRAHIDPHTIAEAAEKALGF